MDQIPAPILEEIPPQPVSPVNKFLPLILIAVLLLLLIFLSALIFSSPKKDQKTAVLTPTPRPTATPFLPPTIPMVTKQTSTVSASIVPQKIGRLAFIKNGDIYNSDLSTFSLFVKNSTPAADKLTWSPAGNYLAWRVSSQEATSSSLAIYERKSKKTILFRPSDFSEVELVDYAWADNEKEIAVLYKDINYNIGILNVNNFLSKLTPVMSSNLPIRQIFWIDAETIVYLKDMGITRLNIASQSEKLIAENGQMQKMKLSPDKKRILYSTGTNTKSSLWIVNTDGGNNKELPEIPGTVDMGTTNLPTSLLNNGFLPYALWFPKGDKLMVGYHYQTNLPVAGIYDLGKNSFSALSTFALYENDFMVDDLRLMGSRVDFTGNTPTWQVAFFTIEDDANLSTIRVIPDAFSPAFFGDDLLPSGNTF